MSRSVGVFFDWLDALETEVLDSALIERLQDSPLPGRPWPGSTPDASRVLKAVGFADAWTQNCTNAALTVRSRAA